MIDILLRSTCRAGGASLQPDREQQERWQTSTCRDDNAQLDLAVDTA
jgi:hypothetical protein